MNVAVTAALPVNVTLQVPVPLQAPDQPEKVELAFGAAVSMTMVPLTKLALHVAPQLIPAGLLVIVPAPVPASWTVSWKELGGGGAFVLNVAVTELLLVNVTLQVPVPLQAPDQPANVELLFGAAVSVTMVPVVKLALHVAPQLIPAGLLVIVPPPVPPLRTVSWNEPGGGGELAVKVAITEVLPVSVTLQVPMPLQAPDQPPNVELAFGAAVSVTMVPLLKLALHVAPQLIPAGLLVIVPAPVPALWAVS